MSETQQKPTLEVFEFAGSPKQMGQDFGEACREQTQELYAYRLQSAIDFAKLNGRRRFDADSVLDLAQRCLPITEAFDPVGYEEFVGIARGAGLTPAQMFVTQGLTDLRDVLAYSDPNGTGVEPLNDPGREGCSSIVVAPDRAANGNLLIGQTWDLLTNNMPYVCCVHRRPNEGPDTLSLTLTGCLTLIGMNSEGVAVGNTNLQARDARVGLQYLSVLHRAMRCRTLDEAAQSVSSAPRSAGHYYYFGDASGRALGLECTATRCQPMPVERGVFIHCNHFMTPELQSLEADFQRDSTEHRQSRLTRLLEDSQEQIDVEQIRCALSDRDGDDCAICRYDSTEVGVSTNATVIMSPQTGEFHACRAQPDHGQWGTWRVGF